jgi:kynurenine formamidase
MPRTTERIVDLTHPLEPSMPVFPLDPKPLILTWTKLPFHPYDSELLHCGTHTGTHIDAPSHFVKGADPVETLKPASCIAPGVILDFRELAPRASIGVDHLRRAEEQLGTQVEKGSAMLIWTGWSRNWKATNYLRDYPGLTEEAAQYLADREVALVGVDSANLDHPDAAGFPAHKTLLGNAIPIVENLTRIGLIRSSWFTFVALPLPIVGATGSPVRAIAVVGWRVG